MADAMNHPQRPMFALILRIGSAFSFATMFAVVKYAGESGIALPEILFWRQAGCLPIIGLYLAMTGRLGEMRTRRIGAHAGRAVIGQSNMAMVFFGTILLPLAESTTLSFASPLFAVLLAALIMRERVGPWRWTAVLCGFAGVVIVANPGADPVSGLGVSLMLIGAFLVAVINFQIRDLARTESPASIVMWFSIFGTLSLLPFQPFFMTVHTPQQWGLIAAIGATGAIGQLLMTNSLRHGAVASVIVMDYTALLWATGFGWLIWDRLPNSSLFIGAPLIVIAGVIIAFREQLLARRRPSDPSGPFVSD
jgi:drug/metabolite transporter (DMT)-like permease